MRRLLVTTTVITFGAAAAVACGGNDAPDSASPAASARGAESTPTTAASNGPPPKQPPQPTNTPAPTQTPAPTATSTAPPSPTPAELTFTDSNTGNGSQTSRSQGPFGIVYADASWGVNVAQNRILVSAFVNVGINERPSATGYLINQFRAPPSDSGTIRAHISTSVNWQGVLAGNGAGGTRAAVSITLSVLEGGRVVATQEVHSLEQREAVLTVGGFDDIDSTNVSMETLLVPDRVYELRLTATCDASSGLIGAATHCVYGPSNVYDRGFVAWGPRTILFGD